MSMNWDLIKTAGLVDCANGRPLAENWDEAKDNSLEKLVVGIDNGDYSTFLGPVLLENKEALKRGIEALAELTGLSAVELRVDEFYDGGALREFLADVPGISFENTMRSAPFAPEEFFVHVETALAVGKLAEDASYKQRKYICVTKGAEAATGELAPGQTINQALDALGIEKDGVKAALVGGMTGAMFTAEEFDTPLTWENLRNGELILVGQDRCVPKLAGQALDYTYRNMCGKCTFCREGMYQMKLIMADVVGGKANAGDVAMLGSLSSAIGTKTLCTRGTDIAGYVGSMLEKAKDEFSGHVASNKCLAGECASFLQIAISGDKCQGCGTCVAFCPHQAIEGKKGYISMNDALACTKCGECIAVCPNGAIVALTEKKKIGPTRPTKVGRYKKNR